MQQDRANPNFVKLRPNFLHDNPDANEEIDPDFQKQFGPFLQAIFLVDSDHAYDQAILKSLAGLL